MAEGARLESVYTLTRIAGSNPALTATEPKGSFFIAQIQLFTHLVFTSYYLNILIILFYTDIIPKFLYNIMKRAVCKCF